MVLKSLSRKSGTHQLLNYLFTNEKKLVGDKQKPILIRHNVHSRTLDKWVKEYDKNESYRLRRRKDNVKIYHTVLSFSNKDKDLINEKMLRDTAKQYMKLRGPDNLFIGTAHFDKDHVHLHMVMSGTKYLTGEANRLSRAEFHQLKLSLDAYQAKKYPELVYSLPRHGRTKDINLSPKEQAKWATMKLYSCSMHPEVRSDKPGVCNKCCKTLHTESLAYSCVNHPDIVNDKPGTCSKCGDAMTLNLSPKEKAKWASMKLYTCPLHPDVRSDKPSVCTVCGMNMKTSTQTYVCPNHADMVSTKTGVCKICGSNFQLNLSPKEKNKYEQMKLFTCPMHPNQKSDKAGKCTICGMALKAS